jgi:hydrogenase maturation protease
MRIVCCGTPCRGDDAVGLVVAERLQQLGIEISACTGEATDLLLAMNGAEEVLIVDAVVTKGAPAGTIYEWHDGGTEFQHNSFTTHGLGVAEGIALARVLGRLPERIHLYSIEAKTLELGGEVSAEVRRATDELARRIADLVSDT